MFWIIISHVWTEIRKMKNSWNKLYTKLQKWSFCKVLISNLRMVWNLSKLYISCTGLLINSNYHTLLNQRLSECLARTSEHHSMMTSSNGNIFRVIGFLWGEFTGHRWIFLTKASGAVFWSFPLLCAWINGWVNDREAGDLRRHRAHYDVIAMRALEHSRKYVCHIWCHEMCRWFVIHS